MVQNAESLLLDTRLAIFYNQHELKEVIAVKHDSTSCNQSANTSNTVNTVSDDSDSVSSSTDVPPEYKKASNRRQNTCVQ